MSAYDNVVVVIVLQKLAWPVTEGGSCGSLFLFGELQMDELVIQIRYQLSILYKASKRIQPNQMRKYMGFPENWEQIRDCPLHKEGNVENV